MWQNLKSLCRKNAAIVLFGSQPFTSALVMSNPDWFRYQWVWNKKLSGNPCLANIQPLKIHEDICVFSQTPHAYYPQMRRGEARLKGVGASRMWKNIQHKPVLSDEYFPPSIIEIYNPKGGEHSTAKPVELLRYLVRTYTNEGGTVLDFTMGSGTAGVACVIEHRNFIGIEKDEHYFKVAEARIKRAQGFPADIPKRVGHEIDTPLFNL